MKVWYHAAIILLIKSYVCNNILQKYFVFTKIFCQMKQNYTKNEHLLQHWNVLESF